MQLTKLTLKNVRCFESLDLAFDAPRVIIEGLNGSGKSSIVEALHYCCYLRSFRSGRTQDMARSDGDGSFFIKLEGQRADDEFFALQVGFSEGTKRVKVNDKVVHTYKDVMQHYRVVTIAEHDLALIQSGPEFRRSFINQYSLLIDPAHADLLRRHKNIVDQRTGLLVRGGSDNELKIWSEQLWQAAREVTDARMKNLAAVEERVNALAEKILVKPGMTLSSRSDAASKQASSWTPIQNSQQKFIHLAYKPKNRPSEQTFSEFWTQYLPTIQKERHMRRNLFGAHLDDIVITMNGRSMRTFASRGQQKLVLLLLTLAQVSVLQELHPDAGVLLVLDDFITDFDATILSKILGLIDTLSCGVVITCPLAKLVTLPEPIQVISLI